jgi:hypothetical protein
MRRYRIIIIDREIGGRAEAKSPVSLDDAFEKAKKQMENNYMSIRLRMVL